MSNTQKVYSIDQLEEAHDVFANNGVVFFNKLLPENVFDEAESKINEKINEGFETKDLVNLHAGEKWFTDFVLRHEFTNVAKKLLGVSRVKIFSSMILSKPPQGKMSVPWHQDAAYDWPLDPVDCASLWLAFDKATVENGAMEVAVSAHNKGAFPMEKTEDLEKGDSHFSSELVKSIPEKYLSDYQKIHLTLDKGCATFHHSMLPHRSNPNLTNTRRCAFIVRYCRGDAKLIKYPGMKREEDFKNLEFLDCREVM